LDEKIDQYLQNFAKLMKELFPTLANPQQTPTPWNPMLPVFSISATINSEKDSEREVLRLENIGSTVADKAAEFCRFLALELRPGESLTVTVERHTDVPMDTVAPVIMAHPA